MSDVEQVENEELAKKQHFEAMERVGQINLFEDYYQQEKLKAAKEKEAAQVSAKAQSESLQQDGEQEVQNGEQNSENGAPEQPNGERIEQNGGLVLEQAVAKLEAEMKKKDPYIQVIGQFLNEFLKQRPDAGEQVMAKDKSIAGSLQAMRSIAEKRKVGNCAVLTDEEGFATVLEYFGVTGQVQASSVDASQMAKQLADKLVINEQPQAPTAVEKVKAPGKLSFDVDIDELL